MINIYIIIVLRIIILRTTVSYLVQGYNRIFVLMKTSLIHGRVDHIRETLMSVVRIYQSLICGV